MVPDSVPFRQFVSYFGVFKITEEMRMDLVLAALKCHRMTEVDCSSSEGPYEFVAYSLATGAMCSFPAERPAQVKRQKVDNGPMMPLLTPWVDVNCQQSMVSKTNSNVPRDYRRY